MKLSFGIDRILSSPSCPAGRKSCSSGTSLAAIVTETDSMPTLFQSYPSSFFPVTAFGKKSFQYQILNQENSQCHEGRTMCTADSESVFDDLTSQSVTQSCGHQRQTDSLSCRVSLQSKHHQQQQASANVSFESGARMRNEEVRYPSSQVSPVCASVRDRDMKRMKEDNQRIINRSVFSKLQRDGLEDAFSKTKYITKQQRLILAQELKLKDFQVKIWFQNRRSKWRNGDNNRQRQIIPCFPHHPLS